jgi:hypothetical protein
MSLIACAAFLALAVWGWGVSLSSLGQSLLIIVLILSVVIVAAGLLIALIKLGRYYMGGRE